MQTNIKGFLELLPKEQILMSEWVDNLKNNYKSYGYSEIETSVVENMDILLAKGSDDKEIYAVKRFFDIQEDKKEAKIGLHFDLTIPFSRYVLNNYSELVFPFKRYQIQKCWRGEMPQLGRYREFLQSDIDVIGNEKLPLYYDSEVLEIALKSLDQLIEGKYEMFLNNRKIFDGLSEYFGLENDTKKQFIKIIDKLDKIGKQKCFEEIKSLNINIELAEFFINSEIIDLNIDIIKQKFLKYSQNSKISQAILEIETIIKNLDEKYHKNVKIKLNLARGLDYYTGSIFEARLIDYPTLSICGGGRYENLTNTIGNKLLPGVGISIGLSRLFGLLEYLEQLNFKTDSFTKILVGGFNEGQRFFANQIANKLRENNINTEVYHDFESKPGKQIKYALSKGINFMLFIQEDLTFELKDLLSQNQEKVTFEELVKKLLI